MDRNHRWDRLLGSFRMYIYKTTPLLSGTLHSDPFQTNRRWTICLDIMVLAYLLLHPRAPNRINLIHIHGTNLRVESRESRGDGNAVRARKGRDRAGLGRAVERVKDGGRANVCPSELDFSPASVSLLATLWLNYLQSTSNIFKLNFMYAQSCIFLLFLRYETALRSTGSIPRRVRETGLFRIRITCRCITPAIVTS